WPTSTEVHPFIEAALEIAPQLTHVSEIVEAKITGPSQIRTWAEPIEIRRRPPNSPAAANSIQFAVAKALSHGEVTLADFTTDGIGDAGAIALAQRISHSFDDQVRGGIVEVLMKDGRSLKVQVEIPLGHPSRPVPHKRVLAKFRDCCRYSTVPLSAGQIQKLIDLIEDIEEVSDVAELTSIANELR
ncbi:MAG: hypothetical protein QOF91_2286, partial [Alphaproteobacteria bacterium]|nr:hypothetical protein [Alphaproteobacteria bacterium]